MRWSIYVFAIAVFALSFFGLNAAAHAEATGTTGPANTSDLPPIPISKCINIGGALEAPREGEWGYSVRRKDLRRIAEAGFDTIRLPVAWSNHSSPRPPHKIYPRFQRRVDAVIRAALDENLNVILDIHHFYQLMQAPDDNAAWLDALWRQLSEHYEGWPDGLIFEFLNEPFGHMDKARVDAMNRRLLPIVRERHPDRWIIMSGSGWGHLDGLLEADIPYDPRAIATFHFYEPFNFTHQGATFIQQDLPVGVDWGSDEDREQLTSMMTSAAEWRTRNGMPLLLGEFGPYAEIELEERAQWTRAVRREADRHDIPWCYWEWATTFKVYDTFRERWLISMRHALLEQ
ncbi:MAG: glycoside hydrolase family 5 protein [Pseudomonadota bacterium]